MNGEGLAKDSHTHVCHTETGAPGPCMHCGRMLFHATTKDDRGERPAFPKYHHRYYDGMTYREWLIGQALEGSSGIYETHGGDSNFDIAIEGVVDTAFRIADAALKRLEEGR